MRWRQPQGLLGSAYIQYRMKILMSKIFFALNTTQLVNRSKEDSCRLVEEMLKKYESGDSKDVYDIVIDESWIYSYEPDT